MMMNNYNPSAGDVGTGGPWGSPASWPNLPVKLQVHERSCLKIPKRMAPEGWQLSMSLVVHVHTYTHALAHT